MELEAGVVVADRYRLDAKLGEGGYGDVWRASRLDRAGLVAIKFLRGSDAQLRRRFELEARALRRLSHPGCVRFIEFGSSDGDPFIVTELLDGPTLSRWLARGPALELRHDMALQLADAVAHAHAQQVTHRDLKPANIIVSTDGDRPVAKVLDFGIAKITGVGQPTDVTKTGEVFGTPGFMSPEQLRAAKDIGPASDVYSLGVLLFWMFEGRMPFEGATSLETAMAHLLRPPPEVTAPVRSGVRELIGRMLSKQPEHRPPIAQVLRTLGGGSEGVPRPTSRGGVQTPNRTTGLARWAAAAALVVVAVLVWRISAPPSASSVAAVREHHADRNRLLKPAQTTGPAAPSGAQPARALEEERTPNGCGKGWAGGVHAFQRLAGLEERTIRARIPAGYAPDVPAPVLVLFHDHLQVPLHLLEMPEFQAIADRFGFVLIAPADEDGADDKWLSERDWLAAIADIEHVGREMCLDRNEIFLFGQGNGGVAADQVACRMDAARGVVTTSYRLWHGRDTCRLGEPVPMLFISPLNDLFAPVAGGTSCLPIMNMWSLDRHEDELRAMHRCVGEPEMVYADDLGQCFAARCEVPLTTCRVEGGRFWKSMPQSKNLLLDACIGLPGEFGYRARIEAFLATHHTRN